MIIAVTTHSIDEVIFHVASALEVPVLIAALVALALVIFELGSFLVELHGRRRRRFATLSTASEQARRDLLAGDRKGAAAAVSGLAQSAAMAGTIAFIVDHAQTAGSDHQRSGGSHHRDPDRHPDQADDVVVAAGDQRDRLAQLIP